jgi:hypothetical protein
MTDEQKTWGGARPGAGRPRTRYILELTREQVTMLVEAMESYSNDVYSTSDDYDPEPLETLRANIMDLATNSTPLE